MCLSLSLASGIDGSGSQGHRLLLFSMPDHGTIITGGAVTTGVANVTSNTMLYGAAIDPETRRREYAICQQRGHTASHFVSRGWAPDSAYCKYCGTEYWTETVEHERGAPDDDA